MAVLAGVASFWTAAHAAPNECKGSPNAAACDIDGDGIANADDPCARDAGNMCDDEGGEDPTDPTLPTLPIDPTTLPIDPTTLVPPVDPGTLPDPTTLVPPLPPV